MSGGVIFLLLLLVSHQSIANSDFTVKLWEKVFATIINFLSLSVTVGPPPLLWGWISFKVPLVWGPWD